MITKSSWTNLLKPGLRRCYEAINFGPSPRPQYASQGRHTEPREAPNPSRPAPTSKGERSETPEWMEEYLK